MRVFVQIMHIATMRTWIPSSLGGWFGDCFGLATIKCFLRIFDFFGMK